MLRSIGGLFKFNQYKNYLYLTQQKIQKQQKEEDYLLQNCNQDTNLQILKNCIEIAVSQKFKNLNAQSNKIYPKLKITSNNKNQLFNQQNQSTIEKIIKLKDFSAVLYGVFINIDESLFCQYLSKSLLQILDLELSKNEFVNEKDLQKNFYISLKKIHEQFLELKKISNVWGLDKHFNYNCDFLLALIHKDFILFFKKGQFYCYQIFQDKFLKDQFQEILIENNESDFLKSQEFKDDKQFENFYKQIKFYSLFQKKEYITITSLGIESLIKKVQPKQKNNTNILKYLKQIVNKNFKYNLQNITQQNQKSYSQNTQQKIRKLKQPFVSFLEFS